MPQSFHTNNNLPQRRDFPHQPQNPPPNFFYPAGNHDRQMKAAKVLIVAASIAFGASIALMIGVLLPFLFANGFIAILVTLIEFLLSFFTILFTGNPYTLHHSYPTIYELSILDPSLFIVGMIFTAPFTVLLWKGFHGVRVFFYSLAVPFYLCATVTYYFSQTALALLCLFCTMLPIVLLTLEPVNYHWRYHRHLRMEKKRLRIQSIQNQ